MSDEQKKKPDLRAGYEQTRTLFEELGFTLSPDGRILYKQSRDFDPSRCVSMIFDHIVSHPALIQVNESQLKFFLRTMTDKHVTEQDSALYERLRCNGAQIKHDDIKEFLSLYLQWGNDQEYIQFRDVFQHMLLTVKRRFYGKEASNPQFVIFTGDPGCGKSRLIKDICNIFGNSSTLDVKNFTELFKDNRGFQTWSNRFVIACHEVGVIPEYLRENVKDMVDATHNSGRIMQTNRQTQTEVVATLIGATNHDAQDILQYDPNNRKIVFLPCRKITKSNGDEIMGKRDQFRADNFLQRWFISLNENGKDAFDDGGYYREFIGWLRRRNAEHTIAEKFIDYLLVAHGGKIVASSALYEVFRDSFHPLLAPRDDGDLKPISAKKFYSKFAYLFEERRTSGERFRVIPTIEQATDRGYSFVDPRSEYYYDQEHLDLVRRSFKDNAGGVFFEEAA